MVYFLVSSAISFLIFEFVALATPTPFRDGWSFTWGQEFTIRVSPTFASTLRLFLIVLIVLLVAMTAILVHDLFTESRLAVFRVNEVSIIVGFIFGIVLAIWINAVFRSDPSVKDIRQTVLVFCLVLLFLVGSFGQDVGHLLQNAASRLTTFSAGGVSLTLNAVSNQRTGAFIGSSFFGAGTGRYHVLSPGFGVGFLAQVEEIMERDCETVNLIHNFQFYHNSELKPYLTAHSPGNSWFKIILYDDPPKCNGSSEYPLLARNIGFFVTDPAQCVNAIYQTTADESFLAGILGDFSPVIRGLFTADVKDEIVEGYVSQSLFRSYTHIIRYMYLNFPQIFDSRSNISNELKEIQRQCHRTVSLICGVSWAPEDNNLLNGCASSTLITTAAREPLTNSQRESQAKLEDEVRQFKAKVHPFYQSLVDRIRQPRSVLYLTISYCALNVALGDYENGLQILSQWIHSHWIDSRWTDVEAEGHVPIGETSNELVFEQVDSEEGEWLLQRARWTEAYFLGAWLNSMGSAANDNMRSVYLRNAEDMIKYYDNAEFTNGLMSLARNVSNECVSPTPDDSNECPFDHRGWQNLVYNYALTKLAFSTHSLGRHDFDLKYKNKSMTYIEDVLHINGSCLKSLKS